MEHTVYLPPMQYTLHEGYILEARYDGMCSFITQELAEKIVADRLRLQQSQPYRILVHTPAHRMRVSAGARSYLDSSRGTTKIAAIAILMDKGWSMYSILRFVIFFQKPGYPIAVFRDRRAAMDWLMKQELDNFSEKQLKPATADHVGDQLVLRALDDWIQIHFSFRDKSKDQAAPSIEKIKETIENAIAQSQNHSEKQTLRAALAILSQPAPRNTPPLTKIEFQLAREMAKGLTTRQIAEKLKKSHRTIEAKRYKLYKKFNVSNGLELIQLLNDSGLFA
jgi:DNA-binding CsgD family transcriptional regulator